MTTKRRGRRPQGEYAGKSLVANFRIRPDTKQLLELAVRASGRTFSQEAEHQLRRSLFEMGTGPTFAIMRVIGSVIDGLINLKNPSARWFDDPYLYGQARVAINGALEVLRPQGNAPEERAESLDHGGKMQGRHAMLDQLREIQLAPDASANASKLTPNERELMMLKSDLGDIGRRAEIYGRTAEQARKDRDLGREFGTLMRKAEKQPGAMTPAEWEHLDELVDEIKQSETERG